MHHNLCPLLCQDLVAYQSTWRAKPDCRSFHGRRSVLSHVTAVLYLSSMNCEEAVLCAFQCVHSRAMMTLTVSTSGLVCVVLSGGTAVAAEFNGRRSGTPIARLKPSHGLCLNWTSRRYHRSPSITSTPMIDIILSTREPCSLLLACLLLRSRSRHEGHPWSMLCTPAHLNCSGAY